MTALFGKSESRYFNARNKIDNVTIENFFTSKKLFIEILIEEMKPVVVGDIGG